MIVSSSRLSASMTGLPNETIAQACRDLSVIEKAGLGPAFLEAYRETINAREWVRFDPQGDLEAELFAGRVAELLGVDAERCRSIARETLLPSRTAAILAVFRDFAQRARAILDRREGRRCA